MSSEAILLAVRLVFAVAAVIAILWFVVAPLWRLLRSGPGAEELEPYRYTMDEVEGEELEVPTEPERGRPDRHRMIELARSDPRRAAMTVSAWLKERKK